MSEYVSVTTTTDSAESAERIARSLLDARLAACVQISAPIESHYRWEGRIESAHEWRVTIKTSAAMLPKMQQAIEGIHPYTTPQILATPIIWGNPAYLAWLGQAIAGER